VADGIRSVAEGDLRKLIKKLFVGAVFLASPDAWWPDAGAAGEVDSREWHFSPLDWERTLARHDRMSAHGIIVLHFPPRLIKNDPAGWWPRSGELSRTADGAGHSISGRIRLGEANVSVHD